FLRFRHRLAPVANITSNASWIFIIAGMLLTIPMAKSIFGLGIAFMAVGVLFQIVTLPVEFNASNRAMTQIVELGIIRNEEEPHAKKVLSAAAMTYVAATAVAVMELLRLVLIFTNRE